MSSTATRSRCGARAPPIAFVGPPNAGKSSLLQALSNIQIKTGDYAFTTTRPVPALTRIRGVLVQLVEIPGLIAGAGEDRGGGRALLGVLRGADAIVFCHDASANPDELENVMAEVRAAGIERPSILAATKVDEADEAVLERLRTLGLEIVPVSVLDDESVEAFRAALWRLSGLIRIFLRKHGEDVSEAVALRPPATVADAARSVHHQLEERCLGASIWGPSARFDGQRVGREHELADDDVVEIVSAR